MSSKSVIISSIFQGKKFKEITYKSVISTVVSCFAWFLSLGIEHKLRAYKYMKTNYSGNYMNLRRIQ
jgi:hypothetical protein